MTYHQRTERLEYHVISVQFELADDLPLNCGIDIKEGRGRILYRINDSLTPEEIVAALNEATAAILAGGHWFQEWHGDIITNSPANLSCTRSDREPLRDVSRPGSAA